MISRLTGLIGLFGLLAVFGQPAEIKVENTAGHKRNQRPPVIFPHEKHTGLYECLDCHHKYQDNKNVLDEGELEEGNKKISCIYCHHSGSSIKLEEAYHGQCRGCHEKARKAGGKNGPVLCGECHRKAK